MKKKGTWTCDVCKTTADICLKPEKMGECPYCKYIDKCKKRIKKDYKRGKAIMCSDCGSWKNLYYGKGIFCCNCYKKKGEMKE